MENDKVVLSSRAAISQELREKMEKRHLYTVSLSECVAKIILLKEEFKQTLRLIRKWGVEKLHFGSHSI